MTEEEFKNKYGKWPEPILGNNWRDEIREYEDWCAEINETKRMKVQDILNEMKYD